MKIFLFGANGMLGSYIYSYFSSQCIPIYRSDLPYLSYSSLKKLFELYSINSNYIVINCIGLIPQTGNTNCIDYININSIFPHTLAEICKEYGCKMIQPTTDCVYNGSKSGYNENDRADETNIYGSSKSCGEPDYASVIRTSIIGEELHHKYSLLEFAKKNANGEINGYVNHFWNGITCLQFCHIVAFMIKKKYFWNGIRHIFSTDSVSKYELLEIINSEFELNIKINSVSNEKYIDKTLRTIYQYPFTIPKIEEQIRELKEFRLIDKSESKIKKTIATISGIRPDFIRMSEIFRLFDKEFNHILIHSGQHYDKLLSDVFFDDLEIRNPDYVLATGKSTSNHYEQLSYLSTEIIKLFKEKNIKPDLIVFLGDSNTVAVSLVLKKEGYRICHIEAGMRSYDKRMFEEINRTVCDHCSDILFVYHDDYKKQLEKENIGENVFVVGNTIVEVANKFKKDIICKPKKNECILLDIHRPENFKYKDRMINILRFANECAKRYGLPVEMLRFHGTCKSINDWELDLGKIRIIDLLSYKKYLMKIYNCRFIISDSGTGQEEPALLKTPVIVPRDYTERPQSIREDCSIMLDVNNMDYVNNIFEWIDDEPEMNIKWMGEGNTSKMITNILKKILV